MMPLKSGRKVVRIPQKAPAIRGKDKKVSQCGQEESSNSRWYRTSIAGNFPSYPMSSYTHSKYTRLSTSFKSSSTEIECKGEIATRSGPETRVNCYDEGLHSLI